MTIEEVKDSIAYCGLVCKLCHLSKECGGCKSNSNCCSKHLSQEGCYQYNCCVKKGIEGCYQCDDFPCNNDMFGESHDVRLRAFVACAKSEGIAKLAEYVWINHVNGIEYGHNKDYDNLGSEEAVLKLLHNAKKEIGNNYEIIRNK